jgi:hypothetical protein
VPRGEKHHLGPQCEGQGRLALVVLVGHAIKRHPGAICAARREPYPARPVAGIVEARCAPSAQMALATLMSRKRRKEGIWRKN